MNEYGFDASTLVTLEDFTTKPIDAVNYAEPVLSSDMIIIDKMINVSNKLLNLSSMDTCPSYKITLENNNTLIGASDQKMWVNTKLWVPFKKIKLEDELITMNGTLVKVLKIEIMYRDIAMYSLNRIENNNTFYVNGYLSCNLL